MNGELRRAKKEYFHHLLLKESKESTTPQTFWKNVKLLMPSKYQVPSSLLLRDHLCSDPVTLANAFNDYLVDIGPMLNRGRGSCSVDSSTGDGQKHVFVAPNGVGNPAIDSPPCPQFSIEPVSHETVIEYLRSLPQKKAAGCDNMPARLVHEAAHIIGPSITKIINHSILTSAIPVEWKRARISPVYKGGNKMQINNYRPISVLPVLSKVLERIVHAQLSYHLETNNLLPPQQSGFRPGYSTMSLLLKLLSDWMTAIDKGCYVGAVFLDLRKAFDTVNHGILLDNLHDVGVNSRSLCWFQNYLADRKQSVMLGNVMSSFKQITCGVPQGSILGPLLFSIYVRDLPGQAVHCGVSQFADDTAVHAASSSILEIEHRLNDDLGQTARWLRSKKLHINAIKTQVVLFGSRRALSKNPELNISLEGGRLQQVNCVKYLGVMLDNILSWNAHVDHLQRKTNRIVKMLRRLRYTVPSCVIQNIYMAIVLPSMDYCDVVWSGCTKTIAKKLEVVQNNAARAILGAPYRSSATVLRTQLGWVTLETRRELNTAVWVYRCLKPGVTPPYLHDIFQTIRKQHQHHTRLSDHGVLIPRAHTNMMLKSFQYRGAVVWNSLPEKVQCMTRVSAFRSALKLFYSESSN